jgi:hypothetical protein
MRRVTLMLAAVAMMVSLFAVVAYAAEIQGSDNSETLIESELNDKIVGHRGDDTIDAAFYSLDETRGGLGDVDKAKGNRNDDTIYVNDGDGLDTANGGKGFDLCAADGGDNVVNCEGTP